MDKTKLMIIYADSDSFIGRGDNEEPTLATARQAQIMGGFRG
jgi:hypothetical protein